MLWEKETITVLVKAAPNWSMKYKTYEICTAGINETGSWRRLYPFHENAMVKSGLRLWDIIQVETTKSNDDPRQESRKIKNESLNIIGHVENKKERRNIIKRLAEQSLEIPMRERRSLTLIEPRIKGFRIREKDPEPIQFTLNGKSFKRHPYGHIGLYYSWSCPQPCKYCKGKSHVTRCFDWGASYLYRKYENEAEARVKVRNKLLYEMKYDNDTWFVLGTTRLRPWKRWMIVGLLWMKREKPTEKPSQVLTNFV